MTDHAAALRQLAVDLIHDHAMDAVELEESGLRAQLDEDEALRHLAGADQDAALETLQALLDSAVVTITWPEGGA